VPRPRCMGLQVSGGLNRCGCRHALGVTRAWHGLIRAIESRDRPLDVARAPAGQFDPAAKPAATKNSPQFTHLPYSYELCRQKSHLRQNSLQTNLPADRRSTL
jgi:hypothetical protein